MWQMLIPAAAQVVGGLLQSQSANKAAELQAGAAREASQNQLQAAREAAALQAGMYKQGLGIQAPQIRGGQLALSALMSGLGLGAATPGIGQVPVPTGDVTPGGMARPAVMPVGEGRATTLAQLAPGVAGNYINAQGITVDAQGNPVKPTGDFGIGNIPVGATAAEMAAAGAPMAGTFREQFTGQDIYMDPSYKFRLEQGQRALAARQAAGGNRLGSQALKDITDYAQGAASQEYGNAYNRFMANKAALYDRLSSLAGLGTQVGSQAAAGGLQTGSNIGQTMVGGQTAASGYLTDAAKAAAGGLVGSTNAITGGINQAMQNWYQQQWMDKYGNALAAARAGGGSMPTPPMGRPGEGP